MCCLGYMMNGNNRKWIRSYKKTDYRKHLWMLLCFMQWWLFWKQINQLKCQYERHLSHCILYQEYLDHGCVYPYIYIYTLVWATHTNGLLLANWLPNSTKSTQLIFPSFSSITRTPHIFQITVCKGDYWEWKKMKFELIFMNIYPIFTANESL